MIAPHSNAIKAAHVVRKQYSGVRVLLVEDNEINQQIAVELIGTVGIRTDIANHGREALDKLTAAGPSGYDLILMDLQMPIMDGHTATIEIRKDTAFNAMPIIAMTAHALAEVSERCMKEGMQDYLTKPISPEQLFHALERWLDPAKQQQVTIAASSGYPTTPLLAITGIDSTLGLSHVAQNHTLYLQLLERFRNSYHDTVERIRMACSQHQYKDAERLAHTLRGVAGNIGATDVQRAAETLELFLSDDMTVQAMPPALEQHVHALESALSTVMQGLDHHFGNPPATQTSVIAQPVSKEMIRIAVHELSVLLQNNSGDAPDFFDRVKTTLAQVMDDGSMTRLATHIRQYEFDEAQQILDSVQQ
jgi:two-component system sensor histidine kinase/response regulator